jgi:methyl-accepting chemotaxis protein
MELLVNSVKQVADLMGDISDASQTQSEGIDRVHQAITEMDKVTQQNAALVQQASGASESMQANALELARLMTAVKLSNQTAA